MEEDSLAGKTSIWLKYRSVKFPWNRERGDPTGVSEGSAGWLMVLKGLSSKMVTVEHPFVGMEHVRVSQN